jgi:multiple sugar transport system ATP-binding protein
MDRYGSCIGREMLFGIRPEHVTDKRPHTESTHHDFTSDVVVLEPMGIDTMVFISIGETEITTRSRPRAVSQTGQPMDFTIDMAHMHLIDRETDNVL